MSAEHKRRLDYLKKKGSLIDAEKEEVKLLEEYLGKKKPKVVHEEVEEKKIPKEEKKKK